MYIGQEYVEVHSVFKVCALLCSPL